MHNEEAQKPIVNLPAKDLPIEPITLHEVDEEVRKRVSLIDKEFNRGFDFIKTQPKSVTIFGSARLPEASEHYQRARRIASKLAEVGFCVMTGGGPGIMEAGNRGAFEADGRSLGLNIKLPHEQVRNPYLNDTVDFYYFFIRKVMLSFSAEAYLFFPGGFGTMDEFFEILTLVQTNKIEKVPIFLVGNEYWGALKKHIMIDQMLKLEMIDEEDLNLFTITEDEDMIVDAIKKVPIRDGVRFTYKDQLK
jgi:uncharacterized protein (TIGR00730 family)